MRRTELPPVFGRIRLAMSPSRRWTILVGMGFLHRPADLLDHVIDRNAGLGLTGTRRLQRAEVTDLEPGQAPAQQPLPCHRVAPDVELPLTQAVHLGALPRIAPHEEQSLLTGLEHRRGR